jgi:hypothetical protein
MNNIAIIKPFQWPLSYSISDVKLCHHSLSALSTSPAIVSNNEEGKMSETDSEDKS